MHITFIHPAVIINLMSTRQPGNLSLISDVEKLSLFSDVAVKEENKEGFSTSEKARIEQPSK